MTRRETLDDFNSTTCSACGSKKAAQQSFCRRCYYALPSGRRLALYQRFGEGYEAAFEAAQSLLKEQRKEQRNAA